MKSGLAKRLDRLEARLASNAEAGFPRFIIGIYDQNSERIVGFGSGKAETIMRRAGEPIETLKDRAWAEMAGGYLFALYGSDSTVDER